MNTHAYNHKSYEMTLELCHKNKSISFKCQHIKYNGIAFTICIIRINKHSHKVIKQNINALKKSIIVILSRFRPLSYPLVSLTYKNLIPFNHSTMILRA